MKKEDVQYYFDQALQLPYNQKLIIPVSSNGEAESVRVTLYRIKREYAFSCPKDKTVINVFKVRGKEGKYFIQLERTPPAPPAFIIDKDGSVVEQLTVPEVDYDACTSTEEIDAVAASMRRDGVSEEEIAKLYRKE